MPLLHFYPPIVTEEIENHYYRYDGYKNAACYAYQILSRTPRGVWVKVNMSDKKFILDGARRRWAYPTIAEALNSFKIRKQRQIMHANASIDNALSALIKVKLEPIPRDSKFTNYDGDAEFW